MIIDEIKYTMEYVEEITKKLGDVITKDDYYIEDMGCPHKQPSSLPTGYAAVYMFAYGNDNEYEFLKIGKVNAGSSARFTSQHYGFDSISTLAKSICFDKEFQNKGIAPNNVKDWMLNNLRRINIYIKTNCGMKATELVESLMHYKFNPRFEGSINSKSSKKEVIELKKGDSKPISITPKKSAGGAASQRIFELLKAKGGKAMCPMLKGEPTTLYLSEFGVYNSGYMDLLCEWHILDAIVEKARELGGVMYKGDSASQSGAKIGSDALPLDTIDAYISINFYGNKVGNSTLRRSTYYSAILAWAGICTNNSARKAPYGRGGFIKLFPEWR
ncbi:MAG: hypothetical protein J6Y28_01925 [Acholeplasmatales bacterium]|nr:hypothetical protein [Acholeplasmatales bacterium]